MLNKYVPPQGNQNTASVAIVGEQPGVSEVFRHVPFVGPAGKVFRDLLLYSRFSNDIMYLTNVIKDLDEPLEAYIVKPTRGAPEFTEKGRIYQQTLIEEIGKMPNLKVIIAVGNVALFALTGRWGITKWRGSIIKCDFCNVNVVPIIHPATIIPPKCVYTNRYLILADLQKAYALYKGTLKFDDIKCLISPTYEEVLDFLDTIEYEGLKGTPIGFDTEIHIVNKQLTCLSFAYKGIGMAIPFVWEMGDYFSAEREIFIMERVARILENVNIKKIIQNAAFDVFIMLKQYGIKIQNYVCTMIAQHCIAPDFPKGLDFITTSYTTVPYYKEDGKMFILKSYGKWETFWNYSALDAIVLTIAFPRQEELMRKHNHYETFIRRLRQVPSIVYMQLCGVRVDMKVFKEMQEELLTEKDIYYAKLIELVGHPININSSASVKKYLYDEKGLSPYKNKEGKITADAKALKSFAKPTVFRNAVEEAHLILSAKKAHKLVSTYLVDEKIDPDGRIRCSYNPCGTRYERLSSSKNIYGTGTNLQNIPHKVFRAFLPEENSFYAALDLSQAENRIVAYVANCLKMIEAFEKGVDIHSLTAEMIMSIYYNGNIPEDVNVKSLSPLGDGSKLWRDWGKRANHGLNYGFGAKAFALLNEVSERDARFIVDSYHSMYPEIRTIFHTHVQHSIKEHRYVENLLGWRTPFLGDFGPETFQKGYASIPQGSVGAIMGEVVHLWSSSPELFNHLKLLVQIHDSVGFSVKCGTSKEEWLVIAKALRKIIDAMERPLLTPLGREFRIPADLALGLTLEKETGIELKAKNIPKDVHKFAEILEESVNGLK